MRSLFILPLLAAAVATPLHAQIVGRNDYGPAPVAGHFLPDSRLPGASIGRQVAHQRERVRDAREAGLISRREARQLHREARLIAGAARRYAQNGLSPSERRELENRSRALNGAISAARVSR